MTALERHRRGEKITRMSKIADCQTEAELNGFAEQCGDTLTKAEREAIARHRAGLKLIAERRGVISQARSKTWR